VEETFEGQPEFSVGTAPFWHFPRIPKDLHEEERRLSVIWEGQLSAFDLPEDVL